MDYAIDGGILSDIADAIREKTGESSPLTPEDMADAIETIETGGGSGSIQIYDSAPTDDEGEIGEIRVVGQQSPYGINSVSSITLASSTYGYGNLFVPKVDLTVIGLRGMIGGNVNNVRGRVQLGTLEDVLAETEENIFTPDQWMSAMLDEPVILSAGTTYLVKTIVTQTTSNTGSIRYCQIGSYTFDAIDLKHSLAPVVGYTGDSMYDVSWPGQSQTKRLCCADIIVDSLLVAAGSHVYKKESSGWYEF